MRVTTRRLLGAPMNGDVDKGQRALSNVLRDEAVRPFPYLVDYKETDKFIQGAGNIIRIPVDDLRYGDILIAAVRECAGAGSFTWPTGWTELWDSVADASNDCFSGAWRFVNFDANEGPAVSTSYSGTNDRSICVCWQFRNATTPVSTGVTAATTTTPNPPNNAPGLGTLDFLWMALTSQEGAPTVSSYPTNYTLNQGFARELTGAGTGQAMLGWAMRELNASSEDPGTFTLSNNEDTMTVTIAIPPG